MQKIVGIAGAKQSGKNTLTNFFCGVQLKINHIIDNFKIDEHGHLVVDGLSVITNEGEGKQDNILLDVSQNNDYRFAIWAADSMWPFVKNYSFAEALKEIAIDLFECPRHLVYGNDDDKRTVMEHLRWENMPGVTTEVTPDDPIDKEVAGRLGKYYDKVLSGVVYHEPGPMTVREFLQFFGTEVMRGMYEPVWVNRCIKDIISESPGLALISDCRFPNEVEAIQKQNGRVIGLTRRPFKDDTHASELSFNLDDCDAVIDNENQTIEETCQEAFQILVDWGWFTKKRSENRKGGTMKIRSDKEGKNV